MSLNPASQGVTAHPATYPFIAPEKYAGKLAGKTVIVAGGSTGIGLATSKAFAAAGAHVAVTSRSEANLAAALSQMQAVAAGGKLLTIAGDVTDPEFANKVVAQALQEFGTSGVDVLMNCAAIHSMEPFRAEPPGLSHWWKVVETGVKGPALFTEAVIHKGGMLERGNGLIISLGSDNGWATFGASSSYGVAKTALLKFHHSLEAELSRLGIYNYYVHPGYVKGTELTKNIGAGSAAFIEEVRATPLRTALVEAFLSGAVPDYPAELGADTCVALAVEEDARALSGTYIEAKDDLGELIQAAKDGKYDGSLYTLGMKTLGGYNETLVERKLEREFAAGTLKM